MTIHARANATTAFQPETPLSLPEVAAGIAKATGEHVLLTRGGEIHTATPDNNAQALTVSAAWPHIGTGTIRVGNTEYFKE